MSDNEAKSTPSLNAVTEFGGFIASVQPPLPFLPEGKDERCLDQLMGTTDHTKVPYQVPYSESPHKDLQDYEKLNNMLDVLACNTHVTWVTFQTKDWGVVEELIEQKFPAWRIEDPEYLTKRIASITTTFTPINRQQQEDVSSRLSLKSYAIPFQHLKTFFILLSSRIHNNDEEKRADAVCSIDLFLSGNLHDHIAEVRLSLSYLPNNCDILIYEVVTDSDISTCKEDKKLAQKIRSGVNTTDLQGLTDRIMKMVQDNEFPKDCVNAQHTCLLSLYTFTYLFKTLEIQDIQEMSPEDRNKVTRALIFVAARTSKEFPNALEDFLGTMEHSWWSYAYRPLLPFSHYNTFENEPDLQVISDAGDALSSHAKAWYDRQFENWHEAVRHYEQGYCSAIEAMTPVRSLDLTSRDKLAIAKRWDAYSQQIAKEWDECIAECHLACSDSLPLSTSVATTYRNALTKCLAEAAEKKKKVQEKIAAELKIAGEVEAFELNEKTDVGV